MVTLDTNPFESNEDQYDAELERIDEIDHEPMQVVDDESCSKALWFRCGKCTYHSQSQELFNRHITRHSMDRPFECTLCKYSGLDHSKFVDHLVFHQQVGVIQCPYCPRALDIPSMKLHMLRHRAMEAFDCSLCDFSSNHVKSLKYHTEIYHNQPSKCEYCQERFLKLSLMKHWDELHDVKEVSADDANELGSPCQCPSMSKRCTLYPDSLVKTEDAQSCGNDYEGASSTNVVGPIAGDLAADVKETFPCHVCEFSSHLRVSLKFHVLSMHTKKVTCQLCSATMTKHSLVQHSKNTHGIYVYFDGKRLQNATEQLMAPKSSNLVRNPKFSANPLLLGNMLLCPICEYSTPRKSNLQTHIDKLHSKTFSCNFCPLITTKYALIKHSSMVHGVTINLKSPSFVEAEPEMHDDDSVLTGGQSCTSGVVSDKSKNLSHQTPIDINQFIELKDNIFFCKICKYRQSWKAQMESHIEKLHVKLYHCKHCSVVTNKYDLIEHSMNTHNVVMSVKTPGLKEYRQPLYDASQVMSQDWQGNNGQGSSDIVFNNCQFEPNSHGQVQNYQKCTKSGGGKSQKAFACSICDFTSNFEYSLTCHIKSFHTLKFHCNDCPKIMTKHELMKHSWNEHGIEMHPRGRCGLREANQDLESDGKIENVSVKGEETSFSGNHFMDDTPDHSLNAHSVPINPNNQLPKELAKGSNSITMEKRMSDSGNSEPEFEPINMTLRGKPNCTFCDHGTMNAAGLKIHVERMHTKKFQCEYCAVVMTKYDLLQHYKNEHGHDLSGRGYRSYKFKKANEPSDPPKRVSGSRMDLSECNPAALSSLASTINTEPGGDESVDGIQQNKENSFKESSYSSNNASCPICSYVAVNPGHLKGHMDRLHRKKFHCAYCPLVMNKYELIKHYKNAHDMRVTKFSKTVFVEADDAENVDEDESLDSNESSDEYCMVNVDGTIHWKCIKCEFTSAYQSSIKTHALSYHTTMYSCDSCSTVMNKFDLIQHYKNDHDITFSGSNCHRGPKFREYTVRSGQTEQCGSQGMNQRDSEVDDSSQTELNNFDCSNSNMTIHEQFIKTLDNSGFSCTICGLSSKSKRTVVIHIERLHLKKFRCDICFAVMPKYNLLQHSKDIHNKTFHNNGKGIRFQEVTEESVSAGKQSEFVHSVPSCPQSTIVPEIESEPTVNQGDSSYITHNGGNFICTLCDWASKYKGNVITHLDTMHRKRFSCIRCSAVMNKFDMIQHYELQHDVVISARGGHKLKYFKNVDHISEGTNEPVLPDDGASSSAYNGDNDLGDQDQSMTIIKDGEKFKCSICGFSTLHKFNLKNHFESFHQKKYSCNDCLFITSKYGMVCHYESVHRFVIPNFGKGKMGPYCTAVTESSEVITASVFADGLVETVMDEHAGTIESVMDVPKCDVEDHLAPITCEGGEYKCPICGISSIWRGNMKAHIDALHNQKYSCDHCSVILTKHEMIEHYVTDHNVKKNVKSLFNKLVDSDTMIQDSSSIESESKGSEWITELNAKTIDDVNPMFVFKDAGEYRCPFCDFSSPVKSASEKHLLVLHKKKYSCNNCSVVCNKYEMMQHFEIEHGVEIPNKGRGQTTRYFTAVDEGAHVVDVVQNEPHHGATAPPMETLSDEPDVQQSTELKCSMCSFSTRWKQNLRTHTENLHEKTFLCNYCSIILTKYEMARHCKDTHGVTISKSGPNLHFVETTHDDPMRIGNEEPKLPRHQSQDGGDSASVASDSSTKDSQCMDLQVESKHKVDDLCLPSGLSNLQKGGSIVFNCLVCDYSSKLRMPLQVHTKTMHSIKHSCNLCSAVMTKHELPGHYEAVHCEENEDVSDADAIQARSLHSCGICNFTTKVKWYLRNHIQKLHKVRYYCPHCGVIMTKHDLIKHVKNVHGFVLSSQQDLSKAEDLLNSSSDDEETHKRSSNLRPSIAGVDIKSDSIEGNDQTIIDKTQCPECDFSTPHQWHLKNHTECFHRKKYNCGRCSQTMTKFELVQHSKDKHGVVLNHRGRMPNSAAHAVSENHASTKNNTEFKKPKRFPCVACTFSSFHSFGLKRHIKLQHSIKYTCHLCSTVLTRYALIKHYRNVHNSEIPEIHVVAAKSLDPSGNPKSWLSGDDQYATSSSSSQILNPKFQAHQQAVMAAIPSSTFQPIVILDRLPIDVDDLDSTFSVLDDTNTADPGRAASSQFSYFTSQME